MHDKFQMSSMGELSFFLGLQVQQKSDGIFISQDKYVADILKRFNFSIVKTASTLMEPNKSLIKDAEAEDVNVHLYRSMIGSLMYLTAFRHDITFVVCTCARFQVTLKTSHLHAVKRIFRYLKGNPQHETTANVKKVNGQEQIQALVDKQKVIITKKSIRRDLKFDDAEGTACLQNDTIFEELSRMGEIPTEDSIPTPSNDLLPSGEDSIQLNEFMIFYTNLQQQVLDLEEAKTAQAKEIANLKKRVKKLDKRRKSRHVGLRRLKKVGSSKQVESSEEKDSLGAQEDVSKQGRSIEDIDQDAHIALVDEAQGRMHDADMFGVDDLEGIEVIVDVREKFVKKNDAPTIATTTDVDDELTLAKTLIAIKATKPKVISTTATIVTTAITTPKAKEPEKPLKKKDQIAFDEEVARKLEAEMKAEKEEEERIAMEKDEASRKDLSKMTLKEKSFNDIKKMFDKVYKRVNTFVDMNIENVEESQKKTQAKVIQCSSKRAGQELEQKSAKKQKLAEQEQVKEVAYDDTVELKRCLEIAPKDDDDVAIEATPLSSKSSTIVDYKIYREGKKSYFKIIRADGNS
nr:putative ribonuclease H-like domain-containing protein [Tanacetum cinerariifolium]